MGKREGQQERPRGERGEGEMVARRGGFVNYGLSVHTACTFRDCLYG